MLRNEPKHQAINQWCHSVALLPPWFPQSFLSIRTMEISRVQRPTAVIFDSSPTVFVCFLLELKCFVEKTAFMDKAQAGKKTQSVFIRNKLQVDTLHTLTKSRLGRSVLPEDILACGPQETSIKMSTPPCAILNNVQVWTTGSKWLLLLVSKLWHSPTNWSTRQHLPSRTPNPCLQGIFSSQTLFFTLSCLALRPTKTKVFLPTHLLAWFFLCCTSLVSNLNKNSVTAWLHVTYRPHNKLITQ